MRLQKKQCRQQIILIWILGMQGLFAFSQSKRVVELIHADKILFDKTLIDAQRLIGHVNLKYNNTLFFCDSAYLYANQNFDAFDHIRIQRETDYTATGDLLFFDQSKKTAWLTKNVVLKDREITLTTSSLLYHLENEEVSYSTGGKIISLKNKNTLTSQMGKYQLKNHVFSFKKNVILKNEIYTVTSDTLRYDYNTEIAYFFGPTSIDSDKAKIYCENGWYQTKTETYQFQKNAHVISGKTILRGDSLFYDGKKEYGEAFRRVSIRDTSNQYLITGDMGRHNEKKKKSIVTGNALMTRFFDDDSLFVWTDTLALYQDSTGQNNVSAYNQVKIFNRNIQGLCNALTYSDADSTTRMFGAPVLWNEENQITGDSISIFSPNGKIKRLTIRGNAFIASLSEADTATVHQIKADDTWKKFHYNQIKGRNAIGYFSNQLLSQLNILGNGQLIYFPTDDKSGTPKILGMNKGECSDIEIGISENKITRIKLMTEPNAVFSPIHLTDSGELMLDGMNWRGNERPAGAPVRQEN